MRSKSIFLNLGFIFIICLTFIFSGCKKETEGKLEQKILLM